MDPETRARCQATCDVALQHDLVLGVIHEQMINLNVVGQPLPEYGLRKIAAYAAQVGAAIVLGEDPADLRCTPEEVREYQQRLVQLAREAGAAVTVSDGKTFEVRYDGANGNDAVSMLPDDPDGAP